MRHRDTLGELFAMLLVERLLRFLPQLRNAIRTNTRFLDGPLKCGYFSRHVSEGIENAEPEFLKSLFQFFGCGHKFTLSVALGYMHVKLDEVIFIGTRPGVIA
jgi:hypothetical protein